MTDVWVWVDVLDEALILRVSYTMAAVLGIPCALWCLWASVRSWRLVRRAGLNGGLLRAAHGYRRRDLVRLFSLCLIAAIGFNALAVAPPYPTPRSLVGLTFLLVLALTLASDGIADYSERQVVVDANEEVSRGL